MVPTIIKTKQRRRSQQSHVAVLETAAMLVGRNGYAKTTVEQIAAEAGVGKQTVYRWWPNKAALFIEVYVWIIPSDIVEYDTGSLVGDLDAMLSQLSRLYHDTPAGSILSGLIAEAQYSPELAKQLDDTHVAPRRKIIGKIISRAALRGEIPRSKDINFASDFISGAILFRLLLGARRLDQKSKRSLIESVIYGLASRDRLKLPSPRMPKNRKAASRRP